MDLWINLVNFYKYFLQKQKKHSLPVLIVTVQEISPLELSKLVEAADWDKRLVGLAKCLFSEESSFSQIEFILSILETVWAVGDLSVPFTF